MSDNIPTKVDVLVGRDNWSTWATDTKLILQKEGLSNVLDDQEPLPIGGHVYNQDKATEDFEAWIYPKHPTPDGLLTIKQIQAGHAEWKNDVKYKRKKWFSDNDHAVSLICNRCSPDVQKLISLDTSAQSVWKKLSDTYSRPDFGKVLEHIQAIREITHAECEGVDDFENRILSLRAQAKVNDMDFDENFWAALAVAGLDESFHSLTQELLSRDTVTLEEVLAKARTEERVIKPTSEVLALDSVRVNKLASSKLSLCSQKAPDKFLQNCSISSRYCIRSRKFQARKPIDC